MIDQDEVVKVSNNMIKFGGSFVKALGTALMSADPINAQKIKSTFGAYWEQYKNLGDDKNG